MNERVAPANARTRLYVVLAMLGLASSALVVRAVDLQVVRKDFYQEQGDARYLRDLDIPVSRGTIFDRNGEPLAVSTPVESIWANPMTLLEHAERIPELANAAGLDEDALKQKLMAYSDKEFVYLKRHLNPDDAQAILKLDIPGVASQREFRRYYPSGEVIGHVLGFTNIDDSGQEGLELAFDQWLAGEKGIKRVIRDRLGHEVENVELVREAKPGKDLTISIDRRIQYLAYRELKAALTEHHASSGSMVILDVPTGEILAMVNQPSFNPNARGNVDPAYRRNRAATDVVEPGSTMKAFTISAALESGKWKPHTPVDTSPGSLTLAGGWTTHDVHNKGLIDVTGVITYSSNVGAAKIALTMTRDHMYDVFHRFGFGEVTGSGFPGESPGNLPIAKSWSSRPRLRMATVSASRRCSLLKVMRRSRTRGGFARRRSSKVARARTARSSIRKSRPVSRGCWRPWCIRRVVASRPRLPTIESPARPALRGPLSAAAIRRNMFPCLPEWCRRVSHDSWVWS
jgi:cell division protein FtsI (penicillin-binding protein 3)